MLFPLTRATPNLTKNSCNLSRGLRAGPIRSPSKAQKPEVLWDNIISRAHYATYGSWIGWWLDVDRPIKWEAGWRWIVELKTLETHKAKWAQQWWAWSSQLSQYRKLASAFIKFNPLWPSHLYHFCKVGNYKSAFLIISETLWSSLMEHHWEMSGPQSLPYTWPSPSLIMGLNM